MEALIAELTELRVPELHEYEPDEVVFEDDRDTAYVEVLEAYGRLLRCGELMWQHHSEFLLLGYGAYATFVDFCKGSLPDIPDQHIAQMVAGIDVLLFRPDAELKRLARLAVETGVDSAFVDGRSPEEIDAELAQSEAGKAWLEELEQVKDPWFNMATGDGLYHYYGSWLDDPTIPYASLVGYVRALKEGEEVERPTEELARERDRLAEQYGSLLDEETRKGFDELLGLSRMVFPYVEEHKFICDYWFLTRWWNKVREFGALLAKHGYLEDAEDVFQLSRHEVASALDELVLVWATGGEPLGPKHWPPIAARRKEILERLEDWTPPPARRRHARGGERPGAEHALGHHHRACACVGKAGGGRSRADGSAGVAGHRRGRRARGDRRSADQRRARRRHPRLPDHVACVGADLLERQGGGHGHRRRHVPCRDRLPGVRPAGRRGYRPRHVADPDGPDDPRRRDGRHRDDRRDLRPEIWRFPVARRGLREPQCAAPARSVAAAYSGENLTIPPARRSPTYLVSRARRVVGGQRAVTVACWQDLASDFDDLLRQFAAESACAYPGG